MIAAKAHARDADQARIIRARADEEYIALRIDHGLRVEAHDHRGFLALGYERQKLVRINAADFGRFDIRVLLDARARLREVQKPHVPAGLEARFGNDLLGRKTRAALDLDRIDDKQKPREQQRRKHRDARDAKG